MLTEVSTCFQPLVDLLCMNPLPNNMVLFSKTDIEPLLSDDILKFSIETRSPVSRVG